MTKFHRDTIVTDLEGVNRYRVLEDKGDVIEVKLLKVDNVELIDGAVIECCRNFLIPVKVPFLTRLQEWFG